MKRGFLILMICILMLTGCQGKQEERDEAMYIAPAEQNGARLACELKLDEAVQSACITVYRLENGKWIQMSGGGYYLCDGTTSGVTIDFEHIAKQISIKFQMDGQSNGSTHQYTYDAAISGLSFVTVVLSEKQEFAFDEEIPVVIQLGKESGTITPFGVQAFFTPEVYAEQGMEYACAITVKFSKEPLEKVG